MGGGREGLGMIKTFRSPDYNYNFDTNNGNFVRWGKDYDDDPKLAPMPEILDFEITEICAGPGGIPCPFCYKSNTPDKGKYTSFEVAKNVIDKMSFVTQIAFGVDAQCTSNPDTFKIMEYARSKGIVPNVTVADISNDTADKLAELCGAVAVSRYKDKSYCYNSIKKLTDRGMKQVNMHIMISKETLPQVYETIWDWLDCKILEDIDHPLYNLNAMVLLSLKTKGRGESFTPLTQDEFNDLCQLLTDCKMPFGFDSCSANKYIEFVNQSDDDKLKETLVYCEPCESGLFSSYVNVDGDFFPCSFSEGHGEWVNGISVVECNNFIEDVWFNPRVNKWTETLLENKRSCPIYNV